MRQGSSCQAERRLKYSPREQVVRKGPFPRFSLHGHHALSDLAHFPFRRSVTLSMPSPALPSGRRPFGGRTNENLTHCTTEDSLRFPGDAEMARRGQRQEHPLLGFFVQLERVRGKAITPIAGPRCASHSPFFPSNAPAVPSHPGVYASLIPNLPFPVV